MVRAGLLVACVVAASPAFAQDRASPSIAGFLNPRTGAFRPVLQPAGAATTTVSGTFVYQLSATVFSVLPTGTKVTCSGTASAYTASGDTEYESAEIAASINGAKLTCKVKIPYKWTLADASGQVSLSYGMTAVSSTGSLVRFLDHSIGSVAIPADGATTQETVATDF